MNIVRKKKLYSYQELSAFCLQISLLLSAAIPLDEGFSIMAEDAVTEEEEKVLLYLSEEIELGKPFAQALNETGVFPPYMIKMAQLGQQTGTLDQILESLSEYYEKEHFLLRNIKNAITYPIIMVVMLLTVLFVLFSKVMPIFEGVYAQLGAQISPVAQTAIKMGGVLSGAALVVLAVSFVVVGSIVLASYFGKRLHFVDVLIDQVKARSKIALATANRRFTSVLSLTLRSGLELEKGMKIASDLVENPKVARRILACSDDLESGKSYYDAMKDTGLFTGFHIQMVKVGTRGGRLDEVMEEISKNYEQQADLAIDHVITRFEPTMVAILAVSVGMILLSVMLPLVGVLSTIG